MPIEQSSRRVSWIVRALVFAGLLIVTVWNHSRGEALGEARAAYGRGDYVTGLRRACDHLDRSPWSREAARVAALCLSRLDFPAAAEPYYRKAGTLEVEDLHVRAYGLVRGNRRREAEEAYRQILLRRPEDPLALRRLGAELITMTRWREALEVAERLARTPDGEVDGLAMIGAIQHHDDKAMAAAAYKRVLQIDPKLERLPKDRGFRRVFWTQLTDELLSIGQPEEARRFLEQAPPEDRGPNLSWLLGRVYYQEGNFDQADHHWTEAVQSDEKLIDAWIDLGRLALGRNLPARAVVALERAAALDPKAYVPAYHLAQAYQRIGKDELAARYRAKVELLRSEAPSALIGTAATSSTEPPESSALGRAP